MIRCSDVLLILGPLLASPAGAQDYIADAFGLVPAEAAQDERARWSGLRDNGTLVSPGQPDRVLIFAGPKSLVAGKDAGHLVAIALDTAGNLVADGTPAQITVAGRHHDVITQSGLASLLLTPPPVAADLLVGATVGPRQSPKAMVSVVADLGSISPTIAAGPNNIPAETPFEIISTPLADRYGNPVPEGTGATVLARHPDGSHSIGFGQSLGERITARFIARDISGPALLSISLAGKTSPTDMLTVVNPTPAGTPELQLELLPSISAMQLNLGPFVTTDGFSLNDGAEVTVTAITVNGAKEVQSIWIQDGLISVTLPIPSAREIAELLVHSPLGPMDLTSEFRAAAAALPETNGAKE